MATEGRREQQRSHKWRPLEKHYGALLPASVISLIPFIVTTTAWELFSKVVAKSIGASPASLELIGSLAVAGYAYGAFLGGDVIGRYPQRRLFLLLEAIYIVGAILDATATGVVQLGAGLVLQGFTTGMLLVVALPPVVRNFPAKKMPLTSAAIDMGLFGAITAGPEVGGAVAATHAWRIYFAGLAGLAALVLLTAALSLPDQDPSEPDRVFDWHGATLGLGAAVLPFYASGVLEGVGFAGWQFTVPLGVGVIFLVALLLTQYHKAEPLTPIKPMWNTYPVVGTLVAMFAGGIFVTLLYLGLTFLTRVLHAQPLDAGLALWPLLPTVVVSAALLGILIRTRWLPVLVLAGMLSLVAAAWILTLLGGSRWSTAPPNAETIIEGAAALLGFGAGATVSPALWIAGFSLPSKMVGRVFALVEMVRSVADFILAPVILEIMHMASWSPHPTPHGVATAAWYMLLISGAATLLLMAIYMLGGSFFPKPDLAAWLEKSQKALHSPPLFQVLRR